MILTDRQIRMMRLVEVVDIPDPDPCPTSSGLSSCGFDLSFDADSLRVSRELLAPPGPITTAAALRDVMERRANAFARREPTALDNGTRYVELCPGEFALCAVNERIKLPLSIMARIFPKSTLARVGLRLEQTIAEPGWEGRLTLEIYNQSKSHIYLLHGMGIAQLTFEQLTGDVELGYADKGGKYQGDGGVQCARMYNPVKKRR